MKRVVIGARFPELPAAKSRFGVSVVGSTTNAAIGKGVRKLLAHPALKGKRIGSIEMKLDISNLDMKEVASLMEQKQMFADPAEKPLALIADQEEKSFDEGDQEDAEEEEEGEEEEDGNDVRLVICRDCKEEPVIYLKSKRGLDMPVNPLTVHPGDDLYDPDKGHESHFKTCRARRRGVAAS